MYYQRGSFNSRGRNNRFGRSSNRGNRFNNQPSPGAVHAFVRKASIQEQKAVEEVKSTMRFSELTINDKLKANIVSHGYSQLMPIQEKVIPAILEGKDVIGIANTGTGKTAAFLIPIIEKIIHNPSFRALIITPTRELALQIREEMRKFTYQIPVYSTFCIGQSSIQNQIYELRRNPHVVIGTPGRLKDLIERKVLKLNFFQMIILDEADQMLDMGFLPDIKHIISYLPEKRQSLFFSATVSPEIDRLIRSFVTNPITISVKVNETTSHIRQEIVTVERGKSKVEILDSLLKKENAKKVLVFGRTKMGVERLSQDLFRKGFKVTSIHGDKPQFKRQQAIRMFKENVVNILVATDVAARGLDIADISHVINYDPPSTYENYIHRIGRTGRADKKGTALTFIEG